MFEPGPDGKKKPESLYGAVKARAHLYRQGIAVARCTVERLMRPTAGAATSAAGFACHFRPHLLAIGDRTRQLGRIDARQV
jgi:hypothetical protein